MTLTAGELIFIDTNILLSATDISRPSFSAAKALLNLIIQAGYSPVITGQIIREYLVVATRPIQVNGFGMTAGDAVHNIKEFQKRLVVYNEKRSSAELLQHLVLEHQLIGKRIHDANIAAVMKTHGIRYIVTDNTADFSCFSDINVLTCSEAIETFK